MLLWRQSNAHQLLCFQINVQLSGKGQSCNLTAHKCNAHPLQINCVWPSFSLVGNTYSISNLATGTKSYFSRLRFTSTWYFHWDESLCKPWGWCDANNSDMTFCLTAAIPYGRKGVLLCCYNVWLSSNPPQTKDPDRLKIVFSLNDCDIGRATSN